MSRSLSVAAISLLIATTGCTTVGPDYSAPSDPAPKAWAEVGTDGAIATGADAALAQWWRGFNDPVLNHLVETALAGNLDLKIAAQRIAEARADQVITAAAGLPSLNAGTEAERQRYSGSVKFPPYSFVFTSLSAGFDASWEIDLWGKTRRAVEAAGAAVESSVADRHAAEVILLGDLGRNYAALRSAQARLDIATRNLKTAEETVRLTQDKFQGGLGSELDLAQARAQRETQAAAIPQFRAAVATSAHAIAVLVGEEPESFGADLATHAGLPPPPPVLPATLPSTVVRNRPDIASAERQIAVANAEVGVAIAQFYPSFTLTPSFNLVAGSLHKLLNQNSLQWGVPAAVSLPLFTGGKLDANLDQARAAYEVARLNYRKTVLTAFQEVEDALIAYREERARHERLVEALTQNRVALTRATDRYRGGLGDFLTVLDSERSLFAAEDALAQSDLTLTQQAIALYKALGAGWTPDPPATTTPSTAG